MSENAKHSRRRSDRPLPNLASFSEDAAARAARFSLRRCGTVTAKSPIGCATAGAEVTIDAAGNLRAFYPAAHWAPRVCSRLSSRHRPKRWRLRWRSRSCSSLSLFSNLSIDRRLPFAIEVIGFSEEEGVRFGLPFIGSRALVGSLDDELLSRRDANGISVRSAIENFGLNPAEIPHAAVSEDALAYFEFHIEQGPVLESLGLPLGGVEAIAAQTRIEFTFMGRANHAGTTPMHLRHDAVAAAAEWIVAVERTALAEPGLVATVGQIEAKPGAINVIPGEARLSLDVRHPSDAVAAGAEESLVHLAEEIAERRGLSLRRKHLLDQKAVAMDPFLVDQIEQAIRAVGCQPHRMASGAGHDAMILAEKIPSAMIFLRSPDGISHDPAESVEIDDVAKALECGMHLLDQLAKSSEFLKRMCRA